MLFPEDLEKVLMPRLTGEFYLTVLGGQGETVGFLAKTEKSLLQIAKRQVLDLRERHVVLLQEPVRIRIVSPNAHMRRKLRAGHLRALINQHRTWLEGEVYDFVDNFRELPPGFKFSKEFNSKNGFNTPIGTCVWTEKDSVLTKFPYTEIEFYKSKGGHSSAPQASGNHPVYTATPGKRSINGNAFGFQPFYPSTNWTPLFHAEILEDLSGLLTPMFEERVALEEKAERKFEERLEVDDSRDSFVVERKLQLQKLFGVDSSGC